MGFDDPLFWYGLMMLCFGIHRLCKLTDRFSTKENA